jgi:hypothetical protein
MTVLGAGGLLGASSALVRECEKQLCSKKEFELGLANQDLVQLE